MWRVWGEEGIVIKLMIRWQKLMLAKSILQLHLLRALRHLWDSKLIGTKTFELLMKVIVPARRKI